MGSMSYAQFLFSFEGRVTRSAYWLKWVLPYLVVMAALGFILSMVAPQTDAYGMPVSDPGLLANTMLMASALIYLVSLWPSLAVAAKRWHDRDKSGWWTLITLVPIVGGFWMLIECGFLKGTDGSNRFGDDPLQAGGFQPAMEPQM